MADSCGKTYNNLTIKFRRHRAESGIGASCPIPGAAVPGAGRGPDRVVGHVSQTRRVGDPPSMVSTKRLSSARVSASERSRIMALMLPSLFRLPTRGRCSLLLMGVGLEEDSCPKVFGRSPL